MNHDFTSVTEEGYVLRNDAGDYLAFRASRRTDHLSEVFIRPGRLVDATIFPSKQGPLDTAGIRALEQYSNLENTRTTPVHVTRSSLVSITTAPTLRSSGKPSPT